MKRRLFFLLALVSFASTLTAEPPAKSKTSSKHEKKAGTQSVSKDLVQSANGWSYVKGEWVHPDGYKLASGRIVRTTARPGQPVPKPPGKLALENPQKLALAAAPVVDNTSNAPVDKATERARNIAPKPAPQTGSHIP